MENDEIILNKLEKGVWQFVNQFRGQVSTDDYVEYFLPLFFFKYICDRSKSRYDALRQKFIGLPEHLQFQLQTGRFLIPEEAWFRTVLNRSNDLNVGDELTRAFNTIEQANSNKLGGIFRNADFNSGGMSRYTADTRKFLYKTLIYLESIDLSPESIRNDIVAIFFSSILGSLADLSGRVATVPSFYTPRGIINLVAGIVQPTSDESIYDPACGAGGFLIEMAKSGQEKSDGRNLYGQEINKRVAALARMNLIINELDAAAVEVGDSINNPHFFINEDSGPTLARFDIVVSNPPFSVSSWWRGGPSYGRFDWGMPPVNKGDYAFILHMLASANENGRVAVIVSHGVLFRQGSELEIRKNIIKNNLLDAVIGLPANLFADTGIPAALLLFDKRRQASDNILFINASQQFEQDKRKYVFGKQNIDSVVDIFNAFKNGTLAIVSKTINVPHRIVSKSEIEANGFNINITRYIQFPESEVIVDIDKLQQEIDELDQKLVSVNKKIQRKLDDFGV